MTPKCDFGADRLRRADFQKDENNFNVCSLAYDVAYLHYNTKTIMAAMVNTGH